MSNGNAAFLFHLSTITEHISKNALLTIVVLLLFLLILSFRRGQRNKQLLAEKADLLWQKAQLNASIAQLNASMARILEDLSQEQARLNFFLSMCGMCPEDLLLLEKPQPAQIPNSYRSRIRKYLDRVQRIREERLEWAWKKPVAFGAASPLLEEARKEQAERQRHNLENYRQECCGLEKSKNWIAPAWTKPTEAQVVRVIDGDTLVIKDSMQTYKVRLIGFDAPETKNPKKEVQHFGPEASACMSHLVQKFGPSCRVWLDKTQLESGWSAFDRYGRVCAHVEMGGRLLGALLLRGGFARLLDVFPMDPEIAAQYRHLQDTAKANDEGMWKALNEIQRSKCPQDKTRVKNWRAIQEIADLSLEENSLQLILQRTIQDLMGSLLTRSKNSTILHDVECHYAHRIQEGNMVAVELTQEVLENEAWRVCKVCGGDPLLTK